MSEGQEARSNRKTDGSISTDEPETSGPLAGVRVIDLSANMSGPYATLHLAEQGADVLKVEPPAGDAIRGMGTGRGDTSAFFATLNRSKRSVVLDLEHAEGPRVLERLLDGADVLFQNFRLGVVERWGLSYADLKDRYPRLVYVSISGFGREGPLASLPAYDHVIQAYSGLAAAQATKDGQPMLVPHGIVDKTTGLVAAEAAVAALLSRSRSGHGCHVQISMLDVALNLLWPDGMINHTCLDEVTRLPAVSGSYKLTETADGYVAMVTITDDQFQGLLKAFSLSHYMQDPTLKEFSGRLKYGGKVMREMAQLARGMPSSTVLSRLHEAGVPAMSVTQLEAVAETIQMSSPGSIEELEHPTLGRVHQPRPIARFSEHGDRRVASPELGSDTHRVLREAGFSDDELCQLSQQGVVSSPADDLERKVGASGPDRA